MIFAINDIRSIIVGIAWTTLGILIFFIFYRILLNRLKRGRIEKELYFILHPIENHPASGIVSIYLEMYIPIEVHVTLFSKDKKTNKIIEHKTYSKGGNIIRFDTREFENGLYFYQAESNNQKSKKLIEIRN